MDTNMIFGYEGTIEFDGIRSYEGPRGLPSYPVYELMPKHSSDGFYKVFKDGVLFLEGLFLKGKAIGMITEYHPNGVKRWEGFVFEDTRRGICREWYSNGILKEECDYTTDGLGIGVWTHWKEDGTLDYVEVFSDNEVSYGYSGWTSYRGEKAQIIYDSYLRQKAIRSLEMGYLSQSVEVSYKHNKVNF